MSQTQFATIQNQPIEYQWHGPPPNKATTLVFLHEGLGCVQQWRDFPAKLAEATGCSALVYSRFGYGQSGPCEMPRPIRYMHQEGLTVLPQLLDALNIRDCILIGHSDGGSIALIYAGGTEARPLQGVITEAAHIFNEDICVASIEAAKEQYTKTNMREKLAGYHNNVDMAFYGWTEAWLHPDFRAWNLEEYLPGIQVPLLAIQGKDDQYGTEAQIESIVDLVPSARKLMLTDCNHTPHREQRDATFGAMKAFISALVRRPS